MPAVLLKPPALEPLDVADAKIHLRIGHSAEDALIAALIEAARLHVECAYGLALVAQGWMLRLDRWPPCPAIDLPVWPVAAIETVRVIGEEGDAFIIDAAHYVLDASARPARLVPAVDKGANQPNCFYDPKSAESALPHYSLGHRDDYMQRRHLEAVLAYWREDAGRNPLSLLYGGPMVDVGRIFVWAWDARPFPHFPYLSDTWSDGGNYELDHWLNGRAGAAPLIDLVDGILRHFGYDDAETGKLEGMVDGYVIDSVMSARDALEPLARGFAFDALESGGRMRFVLRSGSSVGLIEPAACVEHAADKPLFTLCRRQETELPSAIKLTYVESARDYRQAAVESRRSTGASRRETVIALPVMISQAAAQAAADRLLFETWTARETANLVLPPSRLALEPGDIVTLFQEEGGPLELRIDEISDGYARSIKATQVDAELYALRVGPVRPGSIAAAPALGEPLA